MSGNILVTCATGGLGGLTIDAMLAQKIPVNTIFGMVRDPKKASAVAFAGKGVSLRTADFSDPKSLNSACTGIQTLMFISSGSLVKRFEQHSNMLKAAKESGVKHIVYTSILKAAKDSKFILTVDHVQTEEALKKLGVPYTIFRDSFYMEVLGWMMGDTLTSGKWSYPAANAKINFVAKADIAEGLAKVLANLGPHVNKVYEIASGKGYTFAELAGIIGKIIGKTIVYNPISCDDFCTGMKAAGMNDNDIKLYRSTAEAISAGQLDSSDSSLEKILGRKPKTMEEYLPNIFKK